MHNSSDRPSDAAWPCFGFSLSQDNEVLLQKNWFCVTLQSVVVNNIDGYIQISYGSSREGETYLMKFTPMLW